MEYKEGLDLYGAGPFILITLWRARTWYLEGTAASPLDDKTKAAWSENNSKVVIWIFNFIAASSALSLQSFVKASYKWKHLQKLYHQTNKAQILFTHWIG